MPLTLQDIQRHVDAGTFARGEDYVRKRKVVDLRVEGERLLAEVSGSGNAVYRQSIRVSSERNGLRIAGDCSCPVSFNCKHVVAALILAAAAAQHAPANGLSGRAEHWLQRLESVPELTRRPPPGAAPDEPLHHLSFLLIPDERSGLLGLHPCKTRIARDGRVAAVSLQDELHALLERAPAWLRAQDEEPLRLLAAVRAGRGGSGQPAGSLGAALLARLCAEGRLLFARTRQRIQAVYLHPIVPGPARHAALGWHPTEDGDGTIGLGWRFDDGAGVDYLMPTQPMSYLAVDADGRTVLGELSLPPELAALPPAAVAGLAAEAPALEPHERAGVAMRLAQLGLERILPLPQPLQDRVRRDIAPVPTLLLDSERRYERGHWHAHDFATMRFDYDGESVEHGSTPVLRRMACDTVESIERDEAAERAAFERLAAFGFAAPPPASPVYGAPWTMALPDEAHWLLFVRSELPRLRAAGWDIETGASYRYMLLEPQEWYAELQEEGGSGDAGGDGWFSLDLGIVVEGRRHALLPLLLQMIRAAPQDFSAAALARRDDDAGFVVDLEDDPGEWSGGDGLRVVLPWKRIKPILATLGELYFGERLGRGLRLPLLDAARLAELEQAAQLRWLGGERLRALGRRLHEFGGMRPAALPTGLHAELRPYQHTGLSWMQFLREYGFGGILADDMGLGKTVQALAHILLEKEAGRLDAPALVVAPTSLMDNWQAEAARFAPGLRVVLLHGKERQAAFAQAATADLVLTTYALLGRDEAALRAHRYHLLILDEAQYIKNSRSKAFQVACLLDARHRLCLTGTPVQNHLGELWSQFHFLMPGLLGDDKSFKAVYRKPIEQQGDVARKDLLARRLKPFMLRRTKDKVATELPPKTEVVLPVEFSGAQRDLYETVRVAMDERVREEIERKGVARSQIVILDALLKLRQVCCDPRLLEPGSTAGSAKLEALMELLDTLLSEGRKVLVFSQFTSMLALVAAALRARGVDFVTLSGSTQDRAAPVQAFQQGTVPVFLISLKAGGVGLNLTAADTVIHYDPWWNPAAEHQATDRAWRIGQEQPVFVYKLIARGTLEEKIQDMQRRKGELASALLAPEGGLAAGIEAADLQAMFAAP